MLGIPLIMITLKQLFLTILESYIYNIFHLKHQLFLKANLMPVLCFIPFQAFKQIPIHNTYI